MARRKESDRAQQANDDSDSNVNDDYEEEPNFDDPEGYVDDISEQGNLKPHTQPYGGDYHRHVIL